MTIGEFANHYPAICIIFLCILGLFGLLGISYLAILSYKSDATLKARTMFIDKDYGLYHKLPSYTNMLYWHPFIWSYAGWMKYLKKKLDKENEKLWD
jgi:hypothetical protein